MGSLYYLIPGMFNRRGCRGESRGRRRETIDWYPRSRWIHFPPPSLLFLLLAARCSVFYSLGSRMFLDLSRPPSVGAITRLRVPPCPPLPLLLLILCLFFFYFSTTTRTVSPSPASSSSSSSAAAASSSSYLVRLYESRTVLKEVAPFNRPCSYTFSFVSWNRFRIAAVTWTDVSLVAFASRSLSGRAGATNAE